MHTVRPCTTVAIAHRSPKGKAAPEFVCPFCAHEKSEKHIIYRQNSVKRENGKFSDANRLKLHISTNHTELCLKEEVYTCPYELECGYSFKTYEEWFQHLKYYHTNYFIPSYLCQFNTKCIPETT